MFINKSTNLKNITQLCPSIKLIIIMNLFLSLIITQEIERNEKSFQTINATEYIDEISTNTINNLFDKNKISKIDSNKNSNENNRNSSLNDLSIFSKIKLAFSSFIKTEAERANIDESNNLISFSRSDQSKIKSTLNCKSNPKLKSLVISTNFHPNSDRFNIEILRDCEINEMWRSRQMALKSCESPKAAIEGEDNIRRAFRFYYLATNNPDQSLNAAESSIVISNISLEYPKFAAESTLTKSSLTLKPGDVTDIYLNYDCKYYEDNPRSASDDWFKIKFLLFFVDGEELSFEFVKVCNASYIESVDVSHFIIISFIFFVAYLSTKDFLTSKFEIAIVEKYTEMRNPENLLLIGLVVSLILVFFGVIGLFASWTTLVVIIVAPISIAMIGEALFKYYETLTDLESRSYEIPFIGSISFLFSLCLGFGLLLVSLYFYSENWILNNIIAISIALITIRLFKFTNFKLILIMFSLRFIYDLIWSHYYSQYFSENFRLSNNSDFNLPIKFLCPEFASTPFNSCNFLPIADIILPGILCSYAKIFDESKMINVYFMATNASLMGGLFINMFVYYGYKLPLPSFLFTGPIMILTIIIIAHNKGHLHKLVEGFSSTLLENNLDKNIKKISFQQKMKSGLQYIPPKI